MRYVSAVVESRVSAAVVVVIALACASCTHMPWNPYRGWRAVRRGNVVLYTDTLVEHRTPLEWLDRTDQVYRASFFGQLAPAPIEGVYLHEAAGSPFLTDAGTYKQHVALAALPGTGKLATTGLIVVGAGHVPGRPGHVLAHHMLNRAAPKAPLWLHEGLAEFVSHFRVPINGKGMACFGVPQPSDVGGVIMPLDRLFAASWQDYNSALEMWIISTAWALVDYLLLGEGARMMSRFPLLMTALGDGQDSARALTAIYPELALATLDERLRAHARTIRPPGKLCPVGFPVSIKTDEPTVTPVPEADVRELYLRIELVPHRKGRADWFP